MKGHKSYQLILLAAALIAAGCGQPPEGWTPVLEETSTGYLEEETERALLAEVLNTFVTRSDLLL